MKKLTSAVISAGLLLSTGARVAQGGSATWDLNPGSGDWNRAANWTPMTVPNGPSDTAAFSLSNTTNVSISAKTEVNGITFDPGANAYTITNSNDTPSSGPLILSGKGIVNNSGTVQTFVTYAGAGSFSGGGDILFRGKATAGSSTTFINNGPIGIRAGVGVTGGETGFLDNSSAGNGTFINNGGTASSGGIGGETNFSGFSSADHGTFINNGGTSGNGIFSNGGETSFGGASGQFSTAANGTFINNGALDSGARGGSTILNDLSTAANGIFINNGGTASGAGGGFTELLFSNAANGTFTNNGGIGAGAGGGFTKLLGNTTTDSATLIANGGTSGGEGGTIFFEDQANGGRSRVEVFGNGSLDISLMNFRNSTRGVTVGSIEGDGNVFLGEKNLTVGSSNLSTTFSGVMQDGGRNGGTGGSLTKTGSGTLDLTGTNTYTGNTNVNGGVLKVDGSITSNTFVNHGGTLAGTGTIDGAVANRGAVSPGDAPGTLTVNGNYTQAGNGTLLIDIAGTSTDQFSVLNVLGTAKLSGLLDPVLLNGFVPTIGESFTFLDYGAVTGTLFIFDRNIDSAPEHWAVTYQSNDAILTVASGNVPVPDSGSTLLLLTLSLLGLATYRQRCWQ